MSGIEMRSLSVMLVVVFPTRKALVVLSSWTTLTWLVRLSLSDAPLSVLSSE